MKGDMKPPVYVRALRPIERATLEDGLRTTNAFTLRRCQILLASAEHQRPAEIAKSLHCASQTVRNAIRDFERRGVDCLQKGSSIPLTVQPILTREKRERLRAIMHQSPRTFGKAQSQWTLKLLAEVCAEQKLSPTILSAPTILDAMVRLGSRWKRAKQWVTSPDPQYALKKNNVTV